MKTDLPLVLPVGSISWPAALVLIVVAVALIAMDPHVQHKFGFRKDEPGPERTSRLRGPIPQLVAFAVLIAVVFVVVAAFP